MADQLLSTQDLANELQIPVRTIYAWKQRGVGPRSLRVGRFIRFRPLDVERWLEEQADTG